MNMNILNMLGKIAGGPWTAGDYSQYIGVKIWPKKRRPINTSLALVWWNRQTHLPSTNILVLVSMRINVITGDGVSRFTLALLFQKKSEWTIGQVRD